MSGLHRKCVIMISIIAAFSLCMMSMGCLDSELSENADGGDRYGNGDTLNPLSQTEWGERTNNEDYVLLIRQVDGKNKLSVVQLRFTLYDADRRDVTGNHTLVTEVYGKPIDDDTLISFSDGDCDGMLSVGDRFIIKSVDHVDDDGTLSPGYAQPGYTFELNVGTQWIMEKEIH